MRDTLTSPTVNCEPDQLYVASDLNLQRCRGTQRIMAPHINTPGDAGSDEKCLWLALRAAVLRLAISSWTAPPTPPAARFWRASGALVAHAEAFPSGPCIRWSSQAQWAYSLARSTTRSLNCSK